MAGTFFERLAVAIIRSLVPLVLKLTTPTQSPSRPPQLTKAYISTSPPSSRPLELRIYLPSSRTDGAGLPIYLNIHGSGFVLNKAAYGNDAPFCCWLADSLGCIVVDVDHRKGPEHPFPAGINDIKDAIARVRELAIENEWAASKIAIGGFSSGGCLALAASAREGQTEYRLAAVCAFYPSTNLSEPAHEKPKPSKPSGSGGDIPSSIRNIFYNCFVPDLASRRDPLCSPLLADPAHYPRSVTIVTAECDSLAREGRQLFEKLEKERPECAVHFEAKGQGHGWDHSAKEGTEADRIRWHAWELARDRLREAFSMSS